MMNINTRSYNKVELLAPAGNLEKLKSACIYGADAVYIGGKQFGLRAYSGNFDSAEMLQGVEFAHSLGKKVYVTVNAYLRDEEMLALPDYLRELQVIGVDAVIVADIGVLTIVRETVPSMPVHISTQANTVNSAGARAWHKLGAQRIVLARELSLEEINVILQSTAVDLEVFVHGAMCMSYSGRCMLSNYLTGRDANRGGCTQPCRWKYNLVEETRPGEHFPVFEDASGTYIFNSKDLCMLGHLPELMDSGIRSFKIEGRMKSAYYVATVTSAYRQAIDAIYAGIFDERLKDKLLIQLAAISHREYCTGFFYGNMQSEQQIYNNNSYTQSHDFVGLALEYDAEQQLLLVEQRNNVKLGDIIEYFQPDGSLTSAIISEMFDECMHSIAVAPHPQQLFYVRIPFAVVGYTILRRSL